MKEKVYPQAANMILNNAYVDDIVNSVKDRDETDSLVRQANHMLNYGGFVVKHWTLSGCDESLNEKSDQVMSSGETSNAMTGGQNFLKSMQKAEQKVLGLPCDQCNDNFHLSVKVSFILGRHKAQTGPNLSLD